MKVPKSSLLEDLIVAFARIALSAGFLSAVADRFGVWGPHGSAGVAWGDMIHFLGYTHRLTAIFPVAFSNLLGWFATFLEIGFGLCLLLGFHARAIASLSGLLLLSFGVSMVMASGSKSPLDASVFAAAGSAFLLSLRSPDRFAWDSRARANS